MALIKLVEKFDKMFKKGYAEEDILDAFVAALERQRVNAENDDLGEVEASMIKQRIDDLSKVYQKWENENEEFMRESGYD